MNEKFYAVVKTRNVGGFDTPTYKAMSYTEFLECRHNEILTNSSKCSKVIYQGDKQTCMKASGKCNTITNRDIISNLLAAEVPGTNGDAYVGTCVNVTNDIKYMYNLTFSKGSKGAGVEVVGFKLFMLDDKMHIIPVSGNGDNINAEYLDVLEEILKGF